MVRALRVLRQEGWIETQQGKGSFVRGRPALAEVTWPERRGKAELDRDESREPGELVQRRPGRCPHRGSRRCWAEPKDRELVSRRRLVRQDGGSRPRW